MYPMEQSQMEELVGRGDVPGWPFGLQPINIRLQYMEALLDPSFSHSPATFSTLSPSPSSFDDIDTDQSTIFNTTTTTTTTAAATLGSLLGLPSDTSLHQGLHTLPPRRSIHRREEEEERRPSTWSPCSGEIGNGGWCSCMRCVMAGAAHDYGGVDRPIDAPAPQPLSANSCKQGGS